MYSLHPPRDAALNIPLKGLPCVSLCVWVGVCGHGSGHRVLFIYRGCVPVPFPTPWVCLPPHCSLKWHPNTPVNTPARSCVSIWFQLLGTHRGRTFFYHTVVEQSESFCTVQVCITVSTQCAVPPLRTSTDFKDAGSDATTCHSVFEERVHPPTACCTCCEADVFDLQRFCFKNRRASKISTRQVGLYPLWPRITNVSAPASVTLPVLI